jgi:hypothetical protein
MVRGFNTKYIENYVSYENDILGSGSGLGSGLGSGYVSNVAQESTSNPDNQVQGGTVSTLAQQSTANPANPVQGGTVSTLVQQSFANPANPVQGGTVSTLVQQTPDNQTQDKAFEDAMKQAEAIFRHGFNPNDEWPSWLPNSSQQQMSNTNNNIDDTIDIQLQNQYLKQIYAYLVETQEENNHVEVQQTVQLKSNSYNLNHVNLILILLYYACCILFAVYLFYLSKIPILKTMSVYMKCGILAVVLTYPLWITAVNQLLLFVIRYLQALILGIPYTKYKRE